MSTMTATAVHAMTPSTLVSLSSSCWSGDFVFSTDDSSVAMLPICVVMPVAVTSIVPVPRVTDVFWNAMLARSPRGTSSSASVIDVLADRRALAGQRRFLRLHRGGPQQPAVGGHDVAGLELDDVAGHQVVRGDLHQGAVPPHARLRLLHRGQRVDALAREHLLAGPDDHVDHHEEADDERRRPLPDGRADRRDRDQHDVHRVAQLLEDHRPHGRGRLRGQGVRAVPLPPGRDLGGRQARRRVGVELRGRGLRVERPPPGGGLAVVGDWGAAISVTCAPGPRRCPPGALASDAIPRCPDRGTIRASRV